jgi:hypothetical protein
VIVAEQVAAALEGGLVTNAVNIPTIGAEDLEALGPFIPLAAKLGRLAMELARDFTNLVRVSADGVRVAGTTIGTDDRHWLVSALGFELDMELAPRMALLLYDDVPGVIGRIGSLFGAAGVNIANMTVSRNREGGKALMAVSLDSPAPPELMEQLREGMDEAYVIQG